MAITTTSNSSGTYVQGVKVGTLTQSNPSGGSIGSNQFVGADGSLYGVGISGNPVLLSSASSGSSSSKSTPKQQVFTITCTGMKPNTIHKFYYEGVDRGQDCIPIKPKPAGSSKVKPGANLVTDSTGRIEFHFYFTSSVEKQVDAANKVKYELPGNKKFELIAAGSSASKIVPFT